ncbi:MAG: YgiQ family radical SAM protein [Clostridia bacterium]|nr:YgiQ family radical SAM protein [Clostridia bacterium]
MNNGFLPVNKSDMLKRGWTEVDFVIVTGDAYVDHPSFGTAIISRVLENGGYKVGIIAQPDWKNEDSITEFGRPRFGFMVNSGNIDSMVAHYTAAKKPRSEDMYSPGAKAGLRPDRAVTVYSKLIRKVYGNIPLIIGGVEASLRRFAHYDYWSDSVLPSVIIDSDADLLSFGMGELQTREIADRLASGEPISSLTDIDGTVFKTASAVGINALTVPSFEECKSSKRQYAIACRAEYDEQDAVRGKRILQKHGDVYVVQNKPMRVLTTEELDEVYALPYMRYYHPMYETMGGVPAIKEVEFSVTHNRGCFGACNFCSIAYHQGRQIATRSEVSVLSEVEQLVKNPHFKGYIHDVGGPTANFRHVSCQKQLELGLCKGKKCLAPTPCKNLECDHTEYLEMLRKIRAVKGVKKVFIRSGIRFDYLLEDKNDEFFRELVEHHVSGQLKVAPEHCSDVVLDKMGKPHIETYRRFVKKFYSITKQIGKEQYLVPYLMSSHPGCRMHDAIELALFLKQNKMRPEQVQDFYPTPGTISTCMYYTELDPYTLEHVFVPKTPSQKAEQRALLQYFKPENKAIVLKALKDCGRTDLIGSGPNCLINAPGYSKLQNPKMAQKGKGRGKSSQKPKAFKAKGRWDPKN